MPLHNVVVVNYKKANLLKIKAQVSSLWANGYILDDCVCMCACVLSDLT